jgi:hypothetical protein
MVQKNDTAPIERNAGQPSLCKGFMQQTAFDSLRGNAFGSVQQVGRA